ncbi:MAG TPA: type II toxin-antitoxin system VapC family toxin [Geminicoccaceae bacterium]|nr:type II toxin-antitoxin system VapC family toxin [Geminicoccaceae bacterium]
MRYLLDTHVLLWWIADDPKLRADIRNTVTDPDHDILVSAASIWEAAIKRAVGKLRFETPVLLDTLQRGGLRVLPITAEHALAAGGLPRHHDDPFDRMLVAQAMAERLTLITRDGRLRDYQVAIIEA